MSNPATLAPPRQRLRRLQALEDAIKYRRSRLAAGCAGCAAGPCDDHSRDAELIVEYEADARAMISELP